LGAAFVYCFGNLSFSCHLQLQDKTGSLRHKNDLFLFTRINLFFIHHV
jgi:hypothetical protein